MSGPVTWTENGDDDADSAPRPVGDGVATLFWRAHRGRILQGAALSAAVAAIGAALLGAAGWLIGAAALGASLIGGLSAAAWTIRALAMLRTPARYGERLTTHDATFRFLAALRGALFRRIAAEPWARVARLRRGVALGRLTADVDALDGLYLRLLLPFATGFATVLGVGLAGVWLAGPVVGLAVATPLAVLGLAAPFWAARAGRDDARRHAAALEALRVRAIDLAAAQPDLAAAGRLEDQRLSALEAGARAGAAAARLRRVERWAGSSAALAGQAGAAAALATVAAQAEALGPVAAPVAALLALSALALTEIVGPLRRAARDYGRGMLGMRRLDPRLTRRDTPPAAPPRLSRAAPALQFRDLTVRPPGKSLALGPVDLSVMTGEVVALAGRSGSGKSSLLAAAAGLLPAASGQAAMFGAPIEDWPEPALRETVAYLPQRAELIGRDVGDALRLADPAAADDDLWAALEAVAMAEAVSLRGGLTARLGEGGAGFSGGESRRLALARLLLRRPAVALLDEPTEGLDAETAERVLDRVLEELSAAAVLIAAHRTRERRRAHREIRIAAR